MYPYRFQGASYAPQMNGYMQPQPATIQQPVQQPTQVIANEGLGLSFDTLSAGQDMPTVPGGVVTEVAKKKRTRKKKDDKPEVINHAEEVNQTVYADTYYDTNCLLRETIAEIDHTTAELKPELARILSTKTMTNKYKSLSDMTSSIGNLYNTKVSAIKELNNSIKAVNDLEYRRAKDNRAFENQNGDDKAIMDLYNAFVSAPTSAGIPSTGSFSVLGPNVLNATLGGGNVIDAVPADPAGLTYNSISSDEAGYQNYLANLTPEQNAMLLESDPNIKEVVMYDAATGAKRFAIVDVRTNQEVPNMVPKDGMFLEDTSIDVRNKVARNTNLNQVWPLIVLNEGKMSEY